MSGVSNVVVRNLTRSYGPRTILSGIDLDVGPGEFVALLGRSGSGKSTLLRALGGLDYQSARSGELRVPERVSIVFQDARLLPWRRVLDNVIFGLKEKDAAAQGRRILAEVELQGRERSWPYELSGGEQQRVALARALVHKPELLLADEPFGALDALTRIRMHALLRRLTQIYRPALILVTHDVDEAIEIADRILVLESGRIIADEPVKLSQEQKGFSREAAVLRARLLSLLGVEGAYSVARAPA